METEYLTCERQQIHVLCESGRALTQITLDDDHNLAEYRPDIQKLIGEKGQVRFDEIKVLQDTVWLRGALHYDVLYRCDPSDGGFAQLSGELPFQEQVRMEGAQESDTVHISPQIEDLSVALINSRKIGVRALLTLRLQLHRTCLYELPAALTDAEQSETIQVQNRQIDALELTGQKKDTSRVRASLTLPSNKPAIREILWYCVQPRGIESRSEEEKLTLSGELFIHMVYRSAEDGQLQCLELAVPVQTEVEAPEADSDSIAWVSVRLTGSELETAEDFDGEERELQLEAVLELTYMLWEERRLSIVQDAYATDSRLEMEWEPVTLQRLLVKNDSRFRLNERIELDPSAGVLQVCSCTGEVQVEEVTPADGRLEVSGILRLRLLYIAADDEVPLVTVDRVLPFQESVEVPQLAPTDMSVSYELEAGIDQLTTTLTDQSQVECKAQIRICVILFEDHTVQNIGSIRRTEFPETQQNTAGMVGYIVKNGESLWDIAKAAHVSVRQLKEWNQLEQDTVQAGDRLMLVSMQP